MTAELEHRVIVADIIAGKNTQQKAPVITEPDVKPKAPVQQRRLRKPQYSNPELTVEYQLQSNEAINAHRLYMEASRSLFTIFISSARLERQNNKKFSGVVQKTKNAVNEFLSKPEKELRSNIAGLEAALAKIQEEKTVAAVCYTAPGEFSEKIRTPEAARLFEIIKNYDRVHILMDRMWLNNLVTATDVSLYKDRWRESFREMVISLNRHAESTKDLAVNKNDRKKSDAQENSDIADPAESPVTEETATT